MTARAAECVAYLAGKAVVRRIENRAPTHDRFQEQRVGDLRESGDTKGDAARRRRFHRSGFRIACSRRGVRRSSVSACEGDKNYWRKADQLAHNVSSWLECRASDRIYCRARYSARPESVSSFVPAPQECRGTQPRGAG